MTTDISLGVFSANKNEPDRYTLPFYEEEYEPDKLICSTARRDAYISPEGRVLPCGLCAGLKMQEDYPTLFEKNFAECISAPEYMSIADMRVKDFLKVNEKCRTCRFTKHCYGGWIKKIVDTVKKARPTAECPVKDLSLLV